MCGHDEDELERSVTAPGGITTRTIHHRGPALLAENLALAPAAQHSTSYALPSVEAWEEFLAGRLPAFGYSSDHNPTVAHLEEQLAILQGTEKAIALSTGKAAISQALLALLKQGDHVILIREGYKSTRFFIEGTLARFGVRSTLIGADDAPRISEILARERTKLVVAESPTNPLTRCIDLERLADDTHRARALLFLDNSIAGFHNHRTVPADLFLHSLSKYGTGIGDSMGGAILGDEELIQRIRRCICYSADTLDPHVARLMIGGLHTYHLRVRAQAATALRIAQHLESHPLVTRVLYPGLESHPDHEIAKRQMVDYGPVLAFDVVGGERVMRAAINALQLFKIAFGTGYTTSIAGPLQLFYLRTFTNDPPGSVVGSPASIRLSVGLEDADDLIGDLDQALEAARHA